MFIVKPVPLVASGDPPDSIRWCWAFPMVVLARVQQSHSRPEAEVESLWSIWELHPAFGIFQQASVLGGCAWNIKIITSVFMVLCCHTKFEPHSHTWILGWTPSTQNQSYSYVLSEKAVGETVSLLSYVSLDLFPISSNSGPTFAREYLALGASNMWQLLPDSNGPRGLFFVANQRCFLRSNSR